MSISTYMQFYNSTGPIVSSETQVDFGSPTLPASITKQPGSYFELPNFAFDVEQTLNIGTQSSGVGAGKVTFNSLQITRKIDAFSPQLFLNCCSGTPFQFVRVFLARTALGGGPGLQVFLVYTFKLVAVKTISIAQSDAAAPMENVTFDYGGLVVEYYKTKQDGTVSTPQVLGGWNRVRNAADASATTVLT